MGSWHKDSPRVRGWAGVEDPTLADSMRKYLRTVALERIGGLVPKISQTHCH